MPVTTDGRRRTTTTIVAVLVALLLATTPVGSVTDVGADPDAEAALLAAIDAERARLGLSPLAPSRDLVAVARDHSERMALQDRLHHNPALPEQVRSWVLLGENVGRGTDTARLHAAFLASPDHRRNLEDPAWTQVGVGVVAHDGQLWVTQVFRRPAGRG